MVASAAPNTPSPRNRTHRISIPTFRKQETIRKISGVRVNAIISRNEFRFPPSLAKAHIIIDDDDLANVKKFTRDFTADVRKEYAGTDDEIKITLDTGHSHKVSVMDQDSQERVIAFLNLIPNGVRHMSAISPGLPQTSTNMGIMRTGTEQFVVHS